MTALAPAIRGPNCLRQFLDRPVKAEFTKIRVRQVAVRGVPGNIALQKQYLLTDGGQTTQQRPIGRGVTIAPGRTQRQADEDQFVPSVLMRPAPIVRLAMRSVSRRCSDAARRS